MNSNVMKILKMSCFFNPACQLSHSIAYVNGLLGVGLAVLEIGIDIIPCFSSI